MKLLSDIRHIANSISRAYKSRPSQRLSDQNLKIKQFFARRGFDYGLQKAKMYYPGAETGVLNNDWSATIYSITSLISSEYKKLCARSESAIRTDAVAKRVQQILNTFVVGQGNKPFPAVKKYNGDPVEGVNDILSRDWERFNDQGVRTGTVDMTMYQFQALEFNTIFAYGADLVNTVNSKPGSWLPYAFQILKPTRLDFSKDTYIDWSGYAPQPDKLIVHGIEMNGKYADPLGFYIEGIANKISSENMALAFNQTECEQYLGIPWLTPALPHIWDNQQLFFDKLKQSRIGAKLGFKMSKEDQPGINDLLETSESGEQFFDLDFQGMVFSNGKPEPISITDPIADTFEALVKLTLLYVAIGQGISYGTLTSDLNNSNFSAARANTIIENRMFRTLYKWFVKTTCQKRWEKFVEWEFLTGRMSGTGVSYSDYLRDPWYYTQCYWLPMDGEDWIDPLKDQQALVLAYKLGQITYQELCSMRGKSSKAVLQQLKREREEIKEAGLDYLLPENINDSGNPAQEQTQLENQNTGDQNAGKK